MPQGEEGGVGGNDLEKDEEGQGARLSLQVDVESE